MPAGAFFMAGGKEKGGGTPGALWGGAVFPPGREPCGMFLMLWGAVKPYPRAVDMKQPRTMTGPNSSTIFSGYKNIFNSLK